MESYEQVRLQRLATMRERRAAIARQLQRASPVPRRSAARYSAEGTSSSRSPNGGARTPSPDEVRPTARGSVSNSGDNGANAAEAAVATRSQAVAPMAQLSPAANQQMRAEEFRADRAEQRAEDSASSAAFGSAIGTPELRREISHHREATRKVSSPEGGGRELHRESSHSHPTRKASSPEGGGRDRGASSLELQQFVISSDSSTVGDHTDDEQLQNFSPVGRWLKDAQSEGQKLAQQLASGSPDAVGATGVGLVKKEVVQRMGAVSFGLDVKAAVEATDSRPTKPIAMAKVPQRLTGTKSEDFELFTPHAVLFEDDANQQAAARQGSAAVVIGAIFDSVDVERKGSLTQVLCDEQTSCSCISSSVKHCC